MNRFVAIVALLSFAVFGYGQSPVTKTRLGSLHPREGLVVTDIDLSATGGGVDTNAVLDLITSATKGLATKAELGGYLPLTGGTLTGDLTVNGFVYSKMLGIEGEIAFADAGSGTVGIVGGGGSLEFFSTSDPLNPKESALVPDGSKVMTETLTNEKLGGYATKADVAAKADKTNVYTRDDIDAKVAAVGNKADEAYSAAEQMVDAVNSLSGTVGAHIRDTKNPHKVTAAQVGAYTTTDVDNKLEKKADKSALDAKQDKLTKDSDPTVGSLLLMGDRASGGVTLDATPGGSYDALAVKGADNRTSVLTPDGSPVLTQTLGDARYAIAGDLAPLAPESIKKTVDGAKWALSADLVSTKTTTATGEASCTLTTQFGSASLSKIQDRLFSGMLDGVGNVAVWWDGSVWNWGAHPVPSDPSSMQSVSTDPSSDADATSLSFSDGSTATIALGAGTEVVETSHLATVEAVATAYVPVARTVNGKPLSADVVLTAAQVGAYTTGDVDGKLSSKQDALTDAQKAVLNGGPYLGKIGNQKIESDELGHGASLEIGYGSSSGGKLHLRGGPYDGGSIIVEDGGMGTASIKKGGKEVATEAYVDDKVKNAVLPTNPTFSNAVLAVGLNIDTNSVDVLNEIASTFGGFPIEETATTVGGLLAALAAAVAWLRKNKADKATTLAGYGITDAATKTELNAKADKSALAAKADKSTTLAGYGITDGATKTELALKADKTALDDLAAKVEYPLYAVPPTGVLKDRALNTTSLASVTVPDNFTDILIRATVETSLSVTMPEAIATKYGDTFPGEAGEYLITITKTGAAEAYVRTIKLEAANA